MRCREVGEAFLLGACYLPVIGGRRLGRTKLVGFSFSLGCHRQAQTRLQRYGSPAGAGDDNENWSNSQMTNDVPRLIKRVHHQH